MSSYTRYHPYPHTFPIKEETVTGDVIDQNALGFTIALTEFPGVTALMPLSELTRRRVKNVHSMMKPGMKNKMFKVIDSDPSKDRLTLSYRGVDEQGRERGRKNDVIDVGEQYDKKTLNILSGFARKFNQRAMELYMLWMAGHDATFGQKTGLTGGTGIQNDPFDEKLFDQIREASIWRFFNPLELRKRIKEGKMKPTELSPYLKDVHQRLIETPEELVNHEFFPESLSRFYLENFRNRVQHSIGKLTQPIQAMSYAPDGRKRIQDLLTLPTQSEEWKAAQQEYLGDTPLKVELTISAPPEYLLTAESQEAEGAKKFLSWLRAYLREKASRLDCEFTISSKKMTEMRPVVTKVQALSTKDWSIYQQQCFPKTEETEEITETSEAPAVTASV